ncbi:MAG: formate dehydrogenase subunit alpha [Burkholderiaceae bacterium]
MNAPTDKAVAALVEFELNGQSVLAGADETLLQAAARAGVEIPHLCYSDGLRPDGNCRACVVEVEGERVLAPSCCRYPTQGMKVSTESDRALKSQRMVLELLVSDAPDAGYRDDSELSQWADWIAEKTGEPIGRRFEPRQQPAADSSHPAMAVNLDACIQCGRCVRACREEQVNDVIGYAWRGDHAKIVFDLDDPMGESTCVACGECVQACPTGALMPKVPGTDEIAARDTGKQIDSLCPFCGVGCQLTYHVADNQIVHVEGRDGPANHGRLCVKGRFGFDYASSEERLTVPLIRREGAVKQADFDRIPENWRDQFREASWEEALDLAGLSLARIRDEVGPQALAGFGSAKGSNEEAYLFQKLVRTGFQSNNVDHCTRLCHASSVAALLEGLGSGAVSNPVSDVLKAEVVFIIGANPTTNHPVAATFIKNAVKRGAKLVIADPRRTDLARHASHVLQFKSGTDVAMLNALLHVIVAENLVDESFVAERCEAFEEIRDNVAAFSPEKMAPICGIDADEIRAVARLYAQSKGSMILWGMGISQHVHGTDNARCLIAMAMLTGQIGKPGSGLHPLRGQNNVQGASDAGLIPMVLPDYQSVGDASVRERFEKVWATSIDPEPGLTVVEILQAVAQRRILGMYIMGENPAMSDPDLQHAREALASLDMLVVQDIFPTETAMLADVILPASAFAEKDGSFTNTDRMVQRGRAALAPPGQAKQDLWIIGELAKRLGVAWQYESTGDVFEEMRQMMPSIAGISWERLSAQGSITYPCESDDDPGQPVVFIDRFPTTSGRAALKPAQLIAPDERPDTGFPFVLITGRQLEHWHTGSMTRRAAVLDAIEPRATATMNGADMDALGLAAGDMARITSRRGEIEISIRRDDGLGVGSIFVPFAYAEAAANRLTNPALDPFGKIPEFKFAAARVERLADSSDS